ncbi:MAG: pilus assembly protein TadG-related protein [Paracoccaceae bacterium]
MFTLTSRLKDTLREFRNDERGVGSTFAIFMAIICIGVGGLAIDSSNAWQTRQHLQTTADAAAHAGALVVAYPSGNNNVTAYSEALALASANMPSSRYGTVLRQEDIVVGRWNVNARTMDTSSTIPNAVQVTTRMDDTNGNPAKTFLLKLIGFSHWRISTVSVAMVDVASCHRDGLVAGGMVDLTSNNGFYNGMCVHGQGGVEMNSNNFFDYAAGVRISMPDPRSVDEGGMFDVKGNGNIGAWESVGERYMEPLLAKHDAIMDLIADLSNPNYDDRPDYIIIPIVNRQTLSNANRFSMAMLVPNAINILTCGNGQASKISIPGDTTVSNMIIIADCPIQFGQGSSIENGVFITTSTDANSFKGANNVRLGLADDCTPGGGAQFVTLGGVNFAADMEYHGSQVIAHGDVQLAAGVQGLAGISVQALGDISVTANNVMGACSGGVDTVADQYVVRLVY